MTPVTEIISHLSSPTEADKELVTRAYNTAKQAHDGHTRYSGEPYFSHVAAVGLRLAQMGLGPRTIAAGLLHDTIEDTKITDEDIRRDFGEEILFLVDGVTKLSSVRYYGVDRHNESLRKLFVATSQDIRVLIIKLLDRLHNMQTLEHVPQEKQKRIATETLEIYVPVAHRLGIGRVRKELEDLAFPYVYPEENERITDLMKDRIEKAKTTLERERKNLQRHIAEAGIKEFSTSYRVKGMYSLYHKLKRKNWEIDQVNDLMAIRVVVGNIEECYQTLGVVHNLWRPLPKRMKDYIAFPKPNGYQSIHTTVATPSGSILELQIRTQKMHQEAEYGIASHMLYKDAQGGPSGKAAQQSWFSKMAPGLFRPFSSRHRQTTANIKSQTKDLPHTARIPAWIHQIGEMYTGDSSSGQEFMDDMRMDFFHTRIFVFTPQGDVVDLPTSATPIDFAYAIHSEVGDHIHGVKVNNKQVQLDSELTNGDIVEIETKKSAKPSPKWVEMAKTPLAKRRIRSALGHGDNH